MFSALNPSSGFHLCPCPLCLERSSPSPPRIPFEQRADYWFCGCLAGLQAESGGGHPLDMTQHSKRAPSSTLTAWPPLSSCLQGLWESWEMVTAELIGRHFIIGSWWLNIGLSFSNSPISSFTKVQNVWSVSQVRQLSLVSNCCLQHFSSQAEWPDENKSERAFRAGTGVC